MSVENVRSPLKLETPLPSKLQEAGGMVLLKFNPILHREYSTQIDIIENRTYNLSLF